MSSPAEPPFTLESDARFRTDGVWIINLTIAYRDGKPAAGSDVEAGARAAVLEALVKEGMKGRSQGAKSVRVYLDEGLGIVTEFDPSA